MIIIINSKMMNLIKEETVGLFDYYLNSNTESTSNVQNNVVYDNVLKSQT